MHTPTTAGHSEAVAPDSARLDGTPPRPTWTAGRLVSIAAQVFFGILTVIDFAEDRTPSALGLIASCLIVLLAFLLLVGVPARGRSGAAQGWLAALSTLMLLGGTIGVTVSLVTGPLGYRASTSGYSSEGVVIDRAAELPRCDATVTGEGPDADAAVWVAHREVDGDRWFFTRAERIEPGSSRWTATLTLGADPGPAGATEDGPEYDLVAFTAGESADAFLGTRGYADPAGGVTGLVYFGALPPGVSREGNGLTVTRLAGPGGPCPSQ